MRMRQQGKITISHVCTFLTIEIQYSRIPLIGHEKIWDIALIGTKVRPRSLASQILLKNNIRPKFNNWDKKCKPVKVLYWTHTVDTSVLLNRTGENDCIQVDDTNLVDPILLQPEDTAPGITENDEVVPIPTFSEHLYAISHCKHNCDGYGDRSSLRSCGKIRG